MKNLMDMMKQAKQLQEKMQEMQATVEAVNETGTAGAGWTDAAARSRTTRRAIASTRAISSSVRNGFVT